MAAAEPGTPEDLRGRERELADFIENASVGLHCVGPDGIILWANQCELDMLGYSREEYIGWHIANFHADQDVIEDILRRLTNKETLHDHEARVVCKDGSVKHVLINSNVMWEGERFVHTRCFTHDITKRKAAEDALKESEARYQRLVELSPDAIAVYAEDRVVFINTSGTKLLGAEGPEQILGRRIADFLHPDYHEVVARIPKIVGEKVPPVVMKFIRLDHTEVFGEMTSVTYVYQDRPAVQIVVRDITERKRTVTLLDTQKQALEMVVSGAPLAEVLTYLALIVERHGEGRAVASILLLDEQGLLRNGATPSLPEDYISAVDGLKADPDVGTCSAAAARGTVIITPDIAADPKWRNLKHLPLALGLRAAWTKPITARDGRVLGTFGTYFRECREPTKLERQVVEILARTAALAIERQQAEAALRKSEEWLRVIFAASRDGILVEDNEQIVYVNQAYADLFGYAAPAQLVGRHVSVVIAPSDRERMLEFGRRRARGELTTSVYEFQGQRQDGTLINVEASVSTSIIGGRAYITTTIRDIAERKQAQAALLKAHDDLERKVLERTAELLDLNTTLQAEIRERAETEEARRELLQQIVTVQEDERRRISRELHDQIGQHLAAIGLLTNSLKELPPLDPTADKRFRQLEEVTDQLAREVERLSWELRPTALDDLGLSTALSNYVAKWSELSHMPVEFHSTGFDEERLAPQVETAIYRIVQEALTNIIKHAGATCVSLILERWDGQVSAVVEDDGCGFDVEAAHTANEGGRNLGLMGMRERATLVGGTFNIESTPGAGTTIFVRIPSALADKKEERFE
ncbi:MAG: PAS domain S-box protein [Acidobacteria bacterium]|nr:PAS domain S-box protein [Acidobacteriota bacterium]